MTDVRAAPGGRRLPLWVTRGLLPGLYFALLAVGMTYPLVTRMGSTVVDQIGDNIYFIWLFGWFKQALFELHVSPYFVPQLNYPEGWHLAYTEIAPASLALGLPFVWMGGPVLSYNIAVLATFFLSGATAYAWLQRLTGKVWSGLLAGTIFAFSPYRIAHFRAGHLNLLGTAFLPLFFWGYFDLLRGEGDARRRGLLAGVSLGLVGLSSIYYLLMTCVVGVVVGGLYLIFRRGRLKARNLWTGLGWAALAGVPLLLVAIYPFVQLGASGGLPDREVFSVIGGSASLSDFFLPSTDHWLIGAWIADTFPRDHWIEGSLYVGVVPLLLSGVAWWRRKDRLDYRQLVPLLTLLGIIAGLIALGTHLHWMEEIVEVTLPGPLAERLGRADLRIRLPGFFLYQIVPFFSKIRVFKRFAVLVLLAVAALAGIGGERLVSRLRASWRVPVAVALLGLVLFEFYPGPFERLAPVQARPVDLWLAEQPYGVVAELPAGSMADQEQVYSSLIHGQPYVGGFFNAYPPAQFRRLRPLLKSFPDPTSVDALKSLGVEYVVVHLRSFEDLNGVMASLAVLELQPAFLDEQEAVYLMPQAGE